MPVRQTVADLRQSRFPTCLGLGANNLAEIIPALNECTQRLLYASGETGWFGNWARVAIVMQAGNPPYITLPRQFARIINMDVCRRPVRIHNAFFEFLPGGVGLKTSPDNLKDWCGNTAGYERDSVPLMRDIDPVNQLVRIYPTNANDVGKRVLITGLDQNGLQIYSTDNGNRINGFFMVLAQPFTTSAFSVSVIQAVQKDVTLSDIIINQVDQTSHVEVLLSRLAPTELNPSYRRYFISRLPQGCCAERSSNPQPLTITAIVKLEYIPVYQDTDQLIVSNISALIEEAQALRYSSMDVPLAASLEQKHHQKAIKLLQNEQRHYEGEETIACVVNSFEGMGLQRNGIGYLT